MFRDGLRREPCRRKRTAHPRADRRRHVEAGTGSTSRVTRTDRTQGSIRQDLVDRVRREIAAGTYDTEARMELALGRLFDTFAAD